LYPWFEETGLGLILPDDLAAFRLLFPYGKVFQCVAEDGQYVTVQYAHQSFRVKPRLFKVVPEPSKKIGDDVTIRINDKPDAATICDIIWNFKRCQPFYFVSKGGKKLKKRYWEEDFLTDAQSGNISRAC